MLEDVSTFPQLVITQQPSAASNYGFWKHHKQALFTEMDGSKLHYREIWNRANTPTRSRCLIGGRPPPLAHAPPPPAGPPPRARRRPLAGLPHRSGTTEKAWQRNPHAGHTGPPREAGTNHLLPKLEVGWLRSTLETVHLSDHKMKIHMMRHRIRHRHTSVRLCLRTLRP